MTKEENNSMSSEEIKKMAQNILDGTDPLMKAIEEDKHQTTEILSEWSDLNAENLVDREAKRFSYRVGRIFGGLFRK